MNAKVERIAATKVAMDKGQISAQHSNNLQHLAQAMQ